MSDILPRCLLWKRIALVGAGGDLPPCAVTGIAEFLVEETEGGEVHGVHCFAEEVDVCIAFFERNTLLL